MNLHTEVDFLILLHHTGVHKQAWGRKKRLVPVQLFRRMYIGKDMMLRVIEVHWLGGTQFYVELENVMDDGSAWHTLEEMMSDADNTFGVPFDWTVEDIGKTQP